jgi:hypothetical protein
LITGKGIAGTFILLVILFSIGAMNLSSTASVEIPVNATVLNSPPLILDISVEESSIDPNSFFAVELIAADNNTLRDIREIIIELTDSTGANPPYIFDWTPEGFSVVSGNGEISVEKSIGPEDFKNSTGTWTFEIFLPGEISSGGWELRGVVADEEDESTRSTLLWINSFISIALSEPASINLSGPISQDASTHITLIYTSNEEVDLLVSSTTFVGVADSSFVLEPSSFNIRIEGSNRHQLSPTPISVGRLRRGAGRIIPLILSVDIPQPFYDQDYEGFISLVLRPI